MMSLQCPAYAPQAMNILLIEDDPMIGASVCQALRSDGMTVDWLRSGEGVDAHLKANSYEAMLLDLGLPRRDGIDILRSLRAVQNPLPVMVITARDTVSDRINGLDAGADDYLVKPFDLDELTARLRALVRRANGHRSPYYRRDAVVINCEAREATLAGAPVALSAREWELLDLLLARPGTIHSRAKLEQQLYGHLGDIDSNVVEVHIHSLRRKLGAELIVNIRGVGYMVPKSE
jgi:DNA-binding response OmpR family regulator